MKITKKSFQSFFTRASFAGLLLGGVAAAQAQTSGTLTGTTTAYNYSTAPWVITSGTGTYPDGGGVATFNPIVGATPGTVATLSTVTIDVSPTLSQIVVNSPFYYNLAAGTGTSIIAASTGLTVNTTTAVNLANAISIVSVPVGFAVTSPISGGGTIGLTKTGTGNFYLAGTNTYTGGTHVNGGLINLAGGDASLGATGTGNGLSFNGGSILFSLATTVGRDIFVDTGGATLYTAASSATTLSGVVSGSGTLSNVGFGSTALTFTGINTHTGAFVARASNAITTLSGTGSFATSSSYDLMGTFTLDNSGTNVANRLSDTAAVTLRGINFISTGNASATSSETIGAVTGTNGINTLLVTPGTGQANSLTLASLARQNNATFNFRGAGLGGTPGAGVSNIYITAPPTGALVGGGGGAGSTGISILPYAIGNSGATTTFTAAGLIGSSFVTYDVNGIRPLATAEYATAFGVNNTDNVRITAATAVPATGVTANAVLLAPATAAASALSGGPINVTSGAFLYSPTANVTGTVSAALNFGTAEGVISNTSLLTMSGALSGSNGLTLSTAYAPTNNYTPNLNLTGANTYTGNTTINAGAVGVSGTVGNGTSGAFGPGSGTVILNGGVILASIVPTASTTFNNNISSIGFGGNYISPSASGFTSVFNGNISLTNNLYIEGFTNAAASGMTFNGVISGTGSLNDTGFSYAVINNNNTYSGGTILSGSTASSYFAGSDTAFGTGPISFNNSSTAGSSIAGVGTTARTLANALILNGTSNGFAGAAPLTLTGAVNLNGTRTLNVTNTALTTFTGVLSSGAVTKGGTGAVAFNSTTGSTYTGGFVNTGLAATSSAIYANNTSGSAFGTGAVSIGANSATVFSTLAGTFTTNGATSIGGRLSPGNTPANLTAATAGQGAIGTANFNTSLTLSSGTTSSLYLEAASATSHDQINVGGTFTINGTVFIATTGGYSFSQGTVIDFADWSSITVGTVAFNTSGATVDPGYQLDTSFFTTDGTIRVTAVPEPGTWAAVVGGLGVLGSMQFARRRRNRRA